MQTRPVKNADRFRPRSAWLVLLGIGTAGTLLGCGCLAAISARHDAWEAAERSSTNLLLALKRDVGRNLTLFDLSLQGVQDALDQPGLNAATPGVRQQALFDRSATAEDLGVIRVADKTGKVFERSTSLADDISDLSGYDFFEMHRKQADLGLYIGRALTGAACGTNPCITLSRRLGPPDGAFAGVVSGTLQLTYLQRLFARMEIGPHGTISLLRTDGQIVWRYPAADGDANRNVADSRTFQRMIATFDGQFVDNSSLDGIDRFYTFARIPGTPLILSVNLAVDDIFAHWRQRAAVIGPTLLIMCAAIVLLTLLFRREMIRRERAENALSIAAARLARLAETDVLTGLGNRRALIREMSRLWREASDFGETFAVLMVDADHFKQVNDCYGHLEGDRALRCIAEHIKSNVDPSYGFVGRYGGEEFVIVLRCDETMAMGLAEAIRSGVACSEVLPRSPRATRLTVSIGVAMCKPAGAHVDRTMLDAADAALYEAKQSGRNAVRVKDMDRTVGCPTSVAA